MKRQKEKEKVEKRVSVSCVTCPNCKDTIYSRARHDFRTCTCGDISIDGGFDYVKLSFKKVCPKVHYEYIETTKQELYNDWNNSIDKYGLLKDKKDYAK